MKSQTHTGSGALASRFTIRTRLGSASALKTAASVTACSSVMPGSATGVQQATGAAFSSWIRVAVTRASIDVRRSKTKA